MKPKKEIIKRPKGMHDILPEDQVYFKRVQKVVESVTNSYTFEKIEKPEIESFDEVS